MENLINQTHDEIMMNAENRNTELGSTERSPAGGERDSEPPGSEVEQDNTSDAGVSRLPISRKVNYYTSKNPPTRSSGSRRKWTKEMYKAAVECKFRAEKDGYIRGIGKVALQYWEQMDLFDTTENNLMTQIRTILSKGWLTPVELEAIKRKIDNIQPLNTEIDRSTSNRVVIEGENQGVIRQDAESMGEAEAGIEQDVVAEENHEEEGVEVSEEEILLSRLKEILARQEKGKIYNCKNVDQAKLKKETAKVNKIMKDIIHTNITDTRNIVQAGAVLVGELVEAKDPAPSKEKIPYWKRRIENDLSRLRKDLSRIEAWFKGKWKRCKEGAKQELDRRYRLKAKGFNTTMEEIRQRIVAKAAKIKRYQNRIKQFQDNKYYSTNQARFFKNLEGGEGETIPPNPQEATKFWSDIWGKTTYHNQDAEWIDRVEGELDGNKQDDIHVSVEDLKGQLRSMPNWKGPGPDGIHGFWLKSFTSIHEALANTLHNCVVSCQIPEWLVVGRTILVMKDPNKGTEVGNYRPIACLNLIWKALTGIFSTKVYAHLDRNGVLPVEQKGCKKGCMGTKDQLAIDKCVLKNCKRRKTNLNMAWIDYKKAYDMVPHSWIIKTLKMVGVADNIIDFMAKSMFDWKTNLFSAGNLLGTVNIKRGIFQGDSFSPLLFVIALIPLTHVLRESKMGYQLEKNGPKINHMLFMDDLKMFGKSFNEIDSLVQTVQQFSEDIKMEFGISKCAVVALKRGKRSHMEGIKLPNGEELGDPDAGGYKYLGVLELDSMLCKEMKSKVKEVYLRRLKLLLKTRLNGKNLFQAINSWAVAVVRYSAAFVNWTQDEMKQLDRDTRQLLIKYGALHKKSNVMRVYIRRKNGGRGLIGIEECVGAELRSVHHYLANSQEVLLAAVAKEDGLDREVIEGKTIYKERIEREKLEAVEKMALHGQFERDTKELKCDKTWNFLSKSDLKRETEGLILAAQEQALNTNAINKNIYGMECSDRCRLCGEALETVTHIVSACSVLAQREYKRRHDKVCLNLHWGLCRKYGLKVCDNWYQHQPEGVMENEDCKILWDFMIQCDRYVEHRRPDIVVINKRTNECQLIDVACPSDRNLVGKRNEKFRNYNLLRSEVAKLWNKRTTIIPIIIGALGSIPEDLSTKLKQLEIPYNITVLQKSVLLGTAGILRQVLSV